MLYHLPTQDELGAHGSIVPSSIEIEPIRQSFIFFFYQCSYPNDGIAIPSDGKTLTDS